MLLYLYNMEVFMRKLIFLDTETTGLDPLKHEIIDIAMIIVTEDERTIYNTKIKPSRILDANLKALEINGYTTDKWEAAPDMAECIHDIQKHLQDGYIIGYNPQFDVGFLEAAFKEYKLNVPRMRSIDLMALSFYFLSPLGLKSLSLDSVRKFLGISTHNAHTALKDAWDCMHLWQVYKKWKIWHSVWYYFRNRVIK